jgi:serine protease inhibitor
MIPKFKYNYSKSLKDVLTAMGMSEAFTSGANFGRMSESINGPLYIDDIFHKTRIEVTEKGTKAAAVTYVMMMGQAARPQKEKKYIELDRPFVYMIVDKNNVPVFIGAATMLDENQR